LASEAVFEAVLNFYREPLTIALRHPRSVMLTLAAVLGLNFYPMRSFRRFRAATDTGLLIGSIQADQSISFQLMQDKTQAVRRHHQEESGGGHRRRLHRGAAGSGRAARPFRHRVRLAQALGAAICPPSR